MMPPPANKLTRSATSLANPISCVDISVDKGECGQLQKSEIREFYHAVRVSSIKKGVNTVE